TVRHVLRSAALGCMKISGNSLLVLFGCCFSAVAQTNGFLATNIPVASTQSEQPLTTAESGTGSHFVALSTNLLARDANVGRFWSVFQTADVEDAMVVSGPHLRAIPAGEQPGGQGVTFAGEIKAQSLTQAPSPDQPLDHLAFSYFEHPFEQQIYDRL